MTVCIAARAGAFVFGASDRMLTSGDIQFESGAPTKIVGLSNAIFMMTAGDSGLQAQIAVQLLTEVGERIRTEPTKWLRISELADRYIDYYNKIRKKRAEDAILAPLYLDASSFVSGQGVLNDRLVNDTARELLNFQMPNISAIFAGHDDSGPHIYLVQEGETNSLEANCMDGVGFASIGSGGRHASSQFMFAKHAWNSAVPDTLFLTYYAKKASEVAPGVGQGTDLVMSGPTPGTVTVINEQMVEKLESEYQEARKLQDLAFSNAKKEIAKYVEDFQRQATAAHQQQTPVVVEPSPANPPEDSKV